jgi:hypothetical protein
MLRSLGCSLALWGLSMLLDSELRRSLIPVEYRTCAPRPVGVLPCTDKRTGLLRPQSDGRAGGAGRPSAPSRMRERKGKPGAAPAPQLCPKTCRRAAARHRQPPCERTGLGGASPAVGRPGWRCRPAERPVAHAGALLQGERPAAGVRGPPSGPRNQPGKLGTGHLGNTVTLASNLASCSSTEGQLNPRQRHLAAAAAASLGTKLAVY